MKLFSGLSIKLYEDSNNGKMSVSGNVGFVCIHLAVIAFIVALVGESWVMGNTTDTSNVTNTTCHKGLWTSSCGRPSRSFDFGRTKVHSRYRVGQWLYTLSAGICFMSIVFSYVFLCCKSCHNSLCCSGFITAVKGLATLAAAAALTIIGLSHDTDNTFPNSYKYLFLGWTYWVAVASGALMFLATLFTGCSARDRLSSADAKNRQHYQRI